MTVDFPDGTALRLQQPLRERLVVAQALYTANRTEEDKAEYLRLLRIFTDLVMRGTAP